MSNTYLGIEIGGTKLQVVVGDQDARIVDRYRVAVEREQGAAGIRDHIWKASQSIRDAHSLQAVGVGFGGPFDRANGTVAKSFQIHGWDGFAFTAWLESLTGLAVAVDNDANTAALGEARLGAGRDYDKVFYVTLGSGMGGGMVIDGHIYHGASPGEAEIGLMLWDKSGTTFESRCCGWAVDRKVRRCIARDPDGALAQLVGSDTGGEARYLAPALEQGDADAQVILAETGEDIAWALSHVSHLFHPQIVVLGGGLSLIGEPLRAAVAAKLPGLLTSAFQPAPKIELALLGEDVVCVGALLLAQGL
ncbi:MAG: ROK family protein [Anaerolineae bacterium]|nr:ROK family protein [Anaerolineae bacterium]